LRHAGARILWLPEQGSTDPRRKFKGGLPTFRAVAALALDTGGEGGYTPASPVGAVAQLGERLNGIQEVRGSIPLGSTSDINVLKKVLLKI
jgi:hypothetical protein